MEILRLHHAALIVSSVRRLSNLVVKRRELARTHGAPMFTATSEKAAQRGHLGWRMIARSCDMALVMGFGG